MVKIKDGYFSYYKIYGIVTKYIDDNNWWFKLDGCNTELKAQFKLSELKRIK